MNSGGTRAMNEIEGKLKLFLSLFAFPPSMVRVLSMNGSFLLIERDFAQNAGFPPGG